MIHTTPDNFVWLNVNDRARNIWNSGLFELYDVDFSRNSEALIENSEDLNSAIERGCVCIEVGHVGRPNQHWFKEADKKLIDGYWYAKVSDIRFG